MTLTTATTEGDGWVLCPRCDGNTSLTYGAWCKLCTPIQPTLDIPKASLDLQWHLDRHQHPGRVPDWKAIEYAIEQG